MRTPYIKNIKENGINDLEMIQSVLSYGLSQFVTVKYFDKYSNDKMYRVYDSLGNMIYYENGDGSEWIKHFYNEEGDEIRYEDSEGCVRNWETNEVFYYK
jgi:signal peptidase I